MSLTAQIAHYLEDNPDAKPADIAKAIGERPARVESGLKEMTLADVATPKKADPKEG